MTLRCRWGRLISSRRSETYSTLLEPNGGVSKESTYATIALRWIKPHDPQARDFAWQAGYGVFSVSASNLGAVRDYVARQEEHHRSDGFQDELRMLLRTHGKSWD